MGTLGSSGAWPMTTVTSLFAEATGDDRSSACHATFELARYGTKEAIAALVMLAKHTETHVRINVAEALAHAAVASEELDGVLLALTHDSRSLVRACAIESGVARRVASLESRLATIVRADPSTTVRATAVEALVDLRASDGVRVFAEALADDDVVVQAYAAWGLGLAGDAAYRPALLAAADRARPRAQIDIFVALHRLGEPTALAKLSAVPIEDELHATALLNALLDLVRRRPPFASSELLRLRNLVTVVAARFPKLASIARDVGAPLVPG